MHGTHASPPPIRPVVSCFPPHLQDEDELFKIHSFIALTKPFKRVLVPVLKGNGGGSGADAQQQQQQWDEEVKEEVETWPIVQAYGLDGQAAHASNGVQMAGTPPSYAIRSSLLHLPA